MQKVECVRHNVHYFINERLELYIVCTCSYSEVENVDAPSPAPSSTSCSADESLSLYCSTSLILKMSPTSHRPVKRTAVAPACWTLGSAAGSSFIKVVPPQMSRVLIISSNVSASCLLHWLQYLLESNCIKVVVYFEMWKVLRYFTPSKLTTLAIICLICFNHGCKDTCIWPPNVDAFSVLSTALNTQPTCHTHQ